ncbi:MAG: right-handed parallel beta-helix repeat-containing protein, partial [Armatimonadetes bacterium]|nr:right-handed parallel beta-helix repeat-containing protein [Armatimonadota bacterium]
MRNKVLIAAVLSLAVASYALAEMTFYVSPKGKDTWSGRLPAPKPDGSDGPFATLEQAQRIARMAQGRHEPQPCTVLIRAGTYYLSAPLRFSPQDSGLAEAPITWAAYPGEKPVISAGRPITGWVKGPGKLWHVDLPEVKAGQWYFHQLFVNGHRRQRARQPNEGYLRTAGPLPEIKDPHKHRGDAKACLGFTFKPGDIKRWPDLADVNIFLYHSWTASLHWIAELDEENHVVRFTERSNWPESWWERNQRYHLENFREALDAPGEWYLDRREGRLYYWPLPGEDMTKALVVAPRLRHVLEFSGEPRLGVNTEYLRFRGLSFQHADWVLGPKDHADGQAAFFLDAAIHATGLRNCVFEDCEVAHVGEYGIWLSQGCRDNKIMHCHLHDLGGGGVKLGEPSSRQGEQEAGHNIVDNCFIHDGGHVFPAGVGVWIGRSSFNQVTHNEICDFYYTGVSVGWSWGYAASSAHDNAVEYNHIHHIGLGVLSDMGGIYTLGRSPGTRLRYNLIHDVYHYRFGAGGIYPDEGSSNLLIENNICYDTSTGGFTQHYGRDNIVRNNIFAFSRGAQLVLGRAEKDYAPFKFTHNIAYSTTGTMFSTRWGQAPLLKSDYNCYWDTVVGPDMDFAGWALEEWHQQGHDQHSIIADPRFRDPEHRDFRLKPDSPALKLGFKPIDMSQTGLYGDAAWVELPRKTPNRKPIITPAPVRRRLTDFSEDFEKTPAGQVPELVTYTDPGGGASVAVTDELARSGHHCLKFTDAPGLKFAWQPHIHWDPFVLRRIARLTFDVRLGEKAILSHEWRDWRGNPYAVG